MLRVVTLFLALGLCFAFPQLAFDIEDSDGECASDRDCYNPRDLITASAVCLNRECTYPCERFCGDRADCSRPDGGNVQCFCPSGLSGDPYISCMAEDVEQLFDDFDLEDIRDATIGTSLSTEEYSHTINDFSQDMLADLWNKNGNVVFSPFSLHTSLAMLTSGSTDGSVTQDELLKALGRFPNIQGLENHYFKLLKDYSTTNHHPLSFGNKMWTKSPYFEQIDGRFFERLDAIYMADIDILSSSNPVKQINNWIEEVTKGKITELIGNIYESLII